MSVRNLRFWGNKENQRAYLEALRTKLGYDPGKMNDWYKVQAADFKNNNGHTLLSRYGGSVSRMFEVVYPQHKWEHWRFPRVPNNFWQNPSNQKRYLDWLGIKLGFSTRNDWYKVTHRDFSSNGGEGLLDKYDNSQLNILASVYTEHNWLPWMFNVLPKSFDPTDKGSLRRYIEDTAARINITSLHEWYNVSPKKEKMNHTILSKNGGLFKVLSQVYPTHVWDEKKLMRAKRGCYVVVPGGSGNTQVQGRQQQQQKSEPVVKNRMYNRKNK